MKFILIMARISVYIFIYYARKRMLAAMRRCNVIKIELFEKRMPMNVMILDGHSVAITNILRFLI